jgi:hypothetical protein
MRLIHLEKLSKTMLRTKTKIRNLKQYLITQIPNFGKLGFGICLGFGD